MNGDSISLKDVKHSPTFVKNIVSLSKLLQDGYKITKGDVDCISLEKDGLSIEAIPQDDGLYYIHLQQTNIVMTTTGEGHKCTLEKAHKLLGHTDIKTTKATAEKLKWNLTTKTMPLCGACALAKARAKGVSKTTSIKATRPGERLFVDLSGPYKKSQANSEYWMLVIDDYSGKAWSSFLKTKSAMSCQLREFLKWFKSREMETKYIRCDAAGENKKYLIKLANEFPFTLETTAPHTPMQNGRVDRVFPTILNRSVAMMIDAKLTDELQAKLWPEFVATATKIYNNTMRANQETTNEEKFSGKTDKEMLQNLVIPGTVAYVTEPKRTSKLEPKSFKCLLLGHADHHTRDTYRLYNPETKSILISRNVRVAPFHGGIKPTEGLEDVIETLSDDEEDE